MAVQCDSKGFHPSPTFTREGGGRPAWCRQLLEGLIDLGRFDGGMAIDECAQQSRGNTEADNRTSQKVSPRQRWKMTGFNESFIGRGTVQD